MPTSTADMACSHLDRCLASWVLLQQLKAAGTFEVDGNHLQMAHVVAAARHGCRPRLTANLEVLQRLQNSVHVLDDHLERSVPVYGANTGFGGSADTRTREHVKLQTALLQLTQAGILSSAENSIPEQAMPTAWVRAAILVRCNLTMRGHSSVSVSAARAVARLLEKGIIPVVPLRGSVSASGDLMPLSYIVGAAGGNPDIIVETDRGRVLTAPEALDAAGLRPLTLGPQEGLALVNGTAASAALGALVVSKAHGLVVLTEALTAMAVEEKALRGSAASFDPFIAQVRPHPGQKECAANIARFLRNSQLTHSATRNKDHQQETLVQDRYSIRSAPQWLEPQLEDLLLADTQISIELNLTCDNPVIDTAEARILSGGNFQAASVTSAVEKTRMALQMMGRLLFAQLTEMANPDLSNGLPASLAADDPSLSFTIKGVEISMAAYMAELSYLAAPMSAHMQVAEMGNQSVNSMAFASGRMTMHAAEILTMMCACSLYACCQALDLRALHGAFKQRAAEAVASITEHLVGLGMEAEKLGELQRELRDHMSSAWDKTGRRDLNDRCKQMTDETVPLLLRRIGAQTTALTVSDWARQSTQALIEAWESTWAGFCSAPHTEQLLGDGTRLLYVFVRRELAVPFHRGLIEQPSATSAELDGRAKKTVGRWMSTIHDAIRDDRLHGRLMDFVGGEKQ